ncbi:MAG: sigma-70 family RNA polymerase sigma factor [Lachnospiraceae bacterium]|nr:sigma-70 family RNA polymerase sigma factor [Lachnospiraceae bacterium]
MAYGGNDYANYTDEELIDRLRAGETQITEYLCDKYKNLVRKGARSMFILGGDTEDLIQEGMIGLFKAVRDYDSGRDASFFTFAELCINRQIYTAVQASRRKKHVPLNEAVSLYSQVDHGEEGEGRFLLEALTDDAGQDPEKVVLDKERMAELEKTIEECLSPFEKQVYDLYLTNMPTSQIAKILGKNEKSTDNALQRLKGKIRKALSDKI